MRSPTQWRTHSLVLGAVVLLLASLPLENAASQTDISSAVANLKYSEIGPAVMGGRVADLAVVSSSSADLAILIGSYGKKQ